MDLNPQPSGGLGFDSDEEHLEFRLRFTNALMLAAVLMAALFIASDWMNINHLGTAQSQMVLGSSVLTGVLMLVLRKRRHWLVPVSLCFVGLSIATHLGGLILASNNELRAVWFYVVVLFSFILLGARLGLGVTVLSMLLILGSQPYMVAPYSRSALFSVFASLALCGCGAYVFSRRAEYFFQRMRAASAQLQVLAFRDPLTGLFNPRAFYEIANQLVLLARRDRQPVSVLFIDLDHFKRINDDHGHDAGDKVLRAVAQTLSSDLRKSDVLGRIGGEEFAICLPCTAEGGARHVAEKLRSRIEALKIPITPGRNLRVTASIGVSERLATDGTVDDIKMRADHAMYLAKVGGRNRVATLNQNPGRT